MSSDEQSPTLEDPVKNKYKFEAESLLHDDEPVEIFTCVICFEDYFTLNKLQSHYIKHIVNKPFLCDKCAKSFFKATTLEKHKTLCHGNVHKIYACELCAEVFRTKKSREVHLDTHYFPKFSCNACFAHFPTRTSLQSHEKTHTASSEENLLFNCMVCDEQFYTLPDLENHMNGHEEKINEHDCEECGQSFFFSYLYSKHRREHFPSLYCNVCQASFSDKNLFHGHEKQHVREHLDGNGVICYFCELCSMTFAFKKELEAHFNNDHEGKRYICLMCPQTFFFSYLLTYHKTTHTELNDIQCPHCPNKLRTQHSLFLHIKSFHGEKKFSCPYCEKKFSTKNKMMKHSSTHTQHKPHACSFCPARFSSKGNLTRHFTHHMEEKELYCESCGKYFTRRDGLNQHRKQHHKPVKCLVCDKTFFGQFKLMKHHREDHLGKPAKQLMPGGKPFYPCEICHKKLKTAQSHMTHMRRHKGDRPFTCPVCSKSFYQEAHLRTHGKNQHADVELPFPCSHCNERYFTKRGLKRHHLKQHPESVFAF